jgi:hypothetical protein
LDTEIRGHNISKELGDCRGDEGRNNLGKLPKKAYGSRTVKHSVCWENQVTENNVSLESIGSKE